jgi:hypothetical protein
LIDEFDSLTLPLLPYLGFSPRLFQERNEFLSTPENPWKNRQFTIKIKDGEIQSVDQGWGGPEHSRVKAIRSLVEGFVGYLEDMVSRNDHEERNFIDDFFREW